MLKKQQSATGPQETPTPVKKPASGFKDEMKSQIEADLAVFTKENNDEDLVMSQEEVVQCDKDSLQLS